MKNFIYLSLLTTSLVESAVHTATASTSMNVTATVADGCAIAATDTNFGAISGYFSVPISVSNGQITVACTLNLDYTVAIGATANANTTFRRMTDGASDYIGYNLYSDSSFSILWGDGINFGAVVSGTGATSPAVYPVYAQIPIGQASVPTGSYEDLAVPVIVSW